jgi:hypothetical protein
MEVRRGTKTIFTDDERVYWPTVEDWKATLPTGADITVIESVPKTIAVPKKWKTTNPVLARFIERARARRGILTHTDTFSAYSGTRRSEIECQIACLYEDMHYRPTCYSDPSDSDYVPDSEYEESIKELEQKLADLKASGRADEKNYYRTVLAQFYTSSDTDDRIPVYHSIKRGEIFMLDGDRWIPFTDPEAPLWFRASPADEFVAI